MTSAEIAEFVDKLRAHIGLNDYVIVSVGVRGPNTEMSEGNVLATVRMGHEEATAEAKYLNDAVTLARGIIVRRREAETKKREDQKQIRRINEKLGAIQ